jgi:hypothetical protein
VRCNKAFPMKYLIWLKQAAVEAGMRLQEAVVRAGY